MYQEAIIIIIIIITLIITVKTIRLNVQYTISSKLLQTIELTVIAFTKMNVEISKINKINL